MALTGTAAPAAMAASAASGAQSMVAVSHAMKMQRGDQVVGQVDFSQPVHVEVALKLRNRSALSSFIATARAPMSPLVKRSISAASFRAQYAPTLDSAQAVAAFLKAQGFTNVHISDNRMLVSGDATADVAQSAFQTSFVKVRTAKGRVGYANSAAAHVPSSIAGNVLSVIGLQNVHYAHTMNVVASQGLHTNSVSGVNPTQFSSIYGGTGVSTAAGVQVGIITQGSLSQTKQDLNTFTSNNGLPSVSTSTVTINGSSSDTSGVGEWNLDSQDIVGMSGGQIGGLIFYNIPTLSNSNLTAAFNRVVSDNQTKIINVSLGECETYAQQDGSAAADDQIFQQAIAQGQTFSVSSGDSGADECGDGGTTPSYPASSPYVVAVGGTTLNHSGSSYISESTWSGGGGSPSTFESKPSWQDTVSGSMRGVPDIAFDADPNSGAQVIVNGATQQIGGTSLAAPLFSGSWARLLASHGDSLGFAGPHLYQLPSSVYHDVTSGSNGGYSASSGWDYATGFGSFDLSAVDQAIGNTSGGGSTGGGGTGGGSNNNVFTNNTNFNIPDQGSTTSSIAVSGESGNAPSDLQVHVHIVHSYRGDLRITLIAPSGASAVLKSPDGSDSASDVDTTYTVDASSVSANGTWKLKVDDVYAGDTGYLDSWSLTF
nr:protease pro-enzyme activation domain-containing protein [Oleiagrimonas sp. C23AA]